MSSFKNCYLVVLSVNNTSPSYSKIVSSCFGLPVKNLNKSQFYICTPKMLLIYASFYIKMTSSGIKFQKSATAQAKNKGFLLQFQKMYTFLGLGSIAK